MALFGQTRAQPPQLWHRWVKQKDLFSGKAQRMKGAEVHAGAASGALFMQDGWNRHIHRLYHWIFNGKIEVAVWNLYIAVQIDCVLLNIGKVNADKGFSGAAFAAEDGYFHVWMIPFTNIVIFHMILIE